VSVETRIIKSNKSNKTIHHPRTAEPTLLLENEGQQDRQQRLTELAAFLRNCRMRLSPETVGLPVNTRRRVHGLKREEVAQRAGVSLDWYIRIEQGRDVNPSPNVLDALASALVLNEVERKHIHFLTRRDIREHSDVVHNVGLLEIFIEQLKEAPAFVLNTRWDILAQNNAAKQLWSSWVSFPEPHNNLLYRFFTDPCFTQQLDNWEQHACLVVRQYRTYFVREMTNPNFIALIQAVADASPYFAQWWSRADISSRDDGKKLFYHPVNGVMKFDYVVLRPSAHDEVEIVAFLPRS
jgi:transcriptional regulator with XRE-family HTH domain